MGPMQNIHPETRSLLSTIRSVAQPRRPRRPPWAFCSAAAESPVHLVDMDPQASLTRAFGRNDPADRLYHSLTSRASLPADRLAPNLTFSPSSIELGRSETELLTEPGREYFLRTCLERTQLPDAAGVLFDCPPSLGILAINCLATAGGLLTVVQPGGFELHALLHLHTNVRIIQERGQPDLHVLGANRPTNAAPCCQPSGQQPSL